jgi:hypothetical protein
MNWEKVKENIAREAYTSIQKHNIHCNNSNLLTCLLMARDIETGKKLPSVKRVQYFADQVFETIMRWDIRSASKLQEVFPQWFPKRLGKGFVIEQTEKGWELIPT